MKNPTTFYIKDGKWDAPLETLVGEGERLPMLFCPECHNVWEIIPSLPSATNCPQDLAVLVPIYAVFDAKNGD